MGKTDSAWGKLINYQCDSIKLSPLEICLTWICWTFFLLQMGFARQLRLFSFWKCFTDMLSLLRQMMVMSDGTSFSSGQSLHLPSLPSNSLSFSEVKKKSSHGPKVRLIFLEDS